MKITLINGCNENTILGEETIKKLCEYLNTKGASYNLNNLPKLNLKNCTGCDSCQSIKPGICVINDGINEILKQYLNSDIGIIITPIKFGSCNSTTKIFIDRTEPLALPYQISKKGKTIMKSRYSKYPNIIFIGIADKNDIDSIENFKDTFANCTLSLASNKVDIKIITNNLDMEKFDFL
jgi:multimeric flavodoxin WrbA